MKRALWLLAPLAMAAELVEAPYRGCVVDGRGELRRVYGVRGAFAWTAGVARGVASAACSDRAIVVKTESALFVLDRDGGALSVLDGVDGPALLALDEAGLPAYAYLPDGRRMLRWSAGEWRASAFEIDGEPLALAASGDGLLVLRRREDGGLWLTRVAPNGGVAGDERLEGAAETGLVDADGAVWLAEGRLLRLRSGDGVERSCEMPGPIQSLTRMSAGWVAVTTEAGVMAAERTQDTVRRYMVGGVR